MRPIVSEQAPLRYPLNELLGTRAHVRLLRVMANEVDGPLTASDIAKRTGLTLPGAQKAISRLYRSGFIARVGGGRKHQYEIRRSDRLMQITLALFRAEKDRYEDLLATIKKCYRRLRMDPPSVGNRTHQTGNGLYVAAHLYVCIRIKMSSSLFLLTQPIGNDSVWV